MDEVAAHLRAEHERFQDVAGECQRLSAEMHAALTAENWGAVLTTADALLGDRAPAYGCESGAATGVESGRHGRDADSRWPVAGTYFARNRKERRPARRALNTSVVALQ